MRIKLIFTEKTSFAYIRDGIAIFEKRVSHYCPFEIITIDASRKSAGAKNPMIQKQCEADSILKVIKPGDYFVLLDEKGKEYSSIQFSVVLQKLMSSLQSDLIFIVGGAYGFDEKVYKRTNMILSLSKMTFSHQMIRLFFLEQLYRAMTIMRNEPYHHG